MSLALTTRLEAVNTILSAAGESPVVSLTATTADAANAESILDEVSRDVQSAGWHFNTEDEVPFVPDNTSHEIALPSNILKIDLDVYTYPDLDVTQRGPRLYNKATRSYTFNQTVKATVVYYLEFDELPEQARRYITVRAARVFHDRFVGSETQHKFTEIDEYTARQNLVAINLRNADVNIFRANARMAWDARRR